MENKEEQYLQLRRYGYILSDQHINNDEHDVFIRITYWLYEGKMYVSIQLNGSIIFCQQGGKL